MRNIDFDWLPWLMGRWLDVVGSLSRMTTEVSHMELGTSSKAGITEGMESLLSVSECSIKPSIRFCFGFFDDDTLFRFFDLETELEVGLFGLCSSS